MKNSKKIKRSKKIPYEILTKIFSNITNKKQLAQCQLTCKGWSRAAQEQLYKKVEIKSSESAKSLLEALEESPSPPVILSGNSI